jgi:hypothetical protein
MLSWLAKKMIARNMAKLREGDPGPTLRLDAQDIRFSFPGDSSWATELQGRDRLETWLQRFVDVGLQIYADEVVLKGFPWSQTICVRGHDHLDSPEGERVYENRYVIWGRISGAGCASTRSTRTRRRPSTSTGTWRRAGNSEAVPMKQRVSVITLGVADLTRARSFYEALGWRTNAAEDDDVAFFQAGDMVLSLWDRARLAEDSCVEDGEGWEG